LFKLGAVAADKTLRMAAAPELPDLDAVALELVQLEQRERNISARRRKLHDRLASFPNELTQRQEREVSAERRELHRRIDVLRAQLAPLRRYEING
jgi:hypothetical protein